MASGVYYNQEVTADMINAIAKDLGHTSFNKFGDEKFGVSELNNITKDLVGAGILLSGDMCQVIKDDGGNFILQTGIIVFENGAKMEITSPIPIEATAGMVVYAFNDVINGRCSIEISDDFPTEGDICKLCMISADGLIQDKRIVAKAKMELYTGNSNWSTIVNHPRPASYTYEYKYTDIPIDVWDKYNYVLFFLAETTADLGAESNNTAIRRIDEINLASTIGADCRAVLVNKNHCSLDVAFCKNENFVTIKTIIDNNGNSGGANYCLPGKVTIMLI